MSSSFSHNIRSTTREGLTRPPFNSHITSDRLRDYELRRPSSHSSNKPRRKSVFQEIGLDDLETSVHPSHNGQSYLGAEARGSKSQAAGQTERDKMPLQKIGEEGSPSWYTKIVKPTRPPIRTSATAPPGSLATIPRLALIAFLIAVVVPVFQYSGGDGGKVPTAGAEAGVIRPNEMAEGHIRARQSSTDVCTRWAQQVANVNGTLYIYGGEATQQSGQTSNKWNNNFLTLDLTKSWQITSPPLSGLPQPSGPPAVAEGYLWNTYTSLFLYGGEFSDTPPQLPLPVSTWEYNLHSSTWIEHASPVTSAGNNSDTGGLAVQRAAEGAGLSVPELGISWYFGGHLDMYTTEGWSNQIARVYLKSMLEFTHPGYTNTGVYSLGSTSGAGSDGVYRNITEGGLQDTAGFTERADGVLVYVPGWGKNGIVLGLAGGTNVSFTEMNIIDVYDIASSTWYKQSTTGTPPPIRVNPCAVVATAPDASSFNVYLYGGQNLIPYGDQIQYSDMWILTIPSFTWIQVNLDGQSQPPARAGHTCTLWDGQMVVVGGYVGTEISCDSPGIYVFNASSLEWSGSFTSLSSGHTSSNGGQDSIIMQGSYGYQVPAAVQSVIGGSSLGGATATIPAVGSATSGPFATGTPPVFTVTQSGATVTQSGTTITEHGTTVVQTASSTSVPAPDHSSSPSSSGPNIGTIVAAVVAAVLGVLAGYLAFCSWLYRRQLALYQDHVAMAQRTAFAGAGARAGAAWTGNERNSGSGPGSSSHSNTNNESLRPGGMIGPFGTEILSPGRLSGGDSSSHTSYPGDQLTPASTGTGSPLPAAARAAGLAPVALSNNGGMGFGRLSEEDEYGLDGGQLRPSGSSTHSINSVDDMMGGQEPSFISVFLNPRRTLRVVNY